MHILHRWSLRMMRADHTRTVLVILAVVAVFAIWVSADFLVISTIQSAGLDEDNTFGINVPSLISCIQADGSGLWRGSLEWVRQLSEELFSGEMFTNSLFRALSNYLYGGLFIGMFIVMYSIFSVSADECLQDFRILTSSGATERQIRGSLLQRAIALSMIGAVAGTAIGIFITRFSTDAGTFHKVLSEHFFQDKRTQLMMVSCMLAAPCAMALAVRFSFRRSRLEKSLRIRKRAIPRRHVLAWRLFGAGGLLGCLSSRKTIRYRVIFTASFAICLAMLAQLYNLLTVFRDLKPMQYDVRDPAVLDYVDLNMDNVDTENVDLRIDCDKDSRTDILNNILQQNADRIGIKSCVTISEPSAWKDSTFVLFDCGWMDKWYTDHHPDRIVTQDGSRALLWESLGFIFLDNASFDGIVRQEGIGDVTDGAIFCNFRYYDDHRRVAPLAAHPDRDVTLYFLPQSIEANDIDRSADAFLRTAEREAEKKTIRILGRIDTMPYVLDIDRPTLIFPERAFPSFADLLSKSKAAAYDMKRTYFLDLTNAAQGTPTLKNMIEAEPRLNDPDWKLFGIEEPDKNDQDKHGHITVYDLQDVNERLETFQDMLPRFLGIVVSIVALGLSVGILNIAHMNRMTRRRANAILDSIGMDKRQQTGMLLYESVRYAVNSITLGWLLFSVIFFPIWGDYQDLLRDNLLLSQSQCITLRSLLLFGTKYDWVPYLRAYVEAFGRTWWIFVGGAVLIFMMLIVSDKAISRRYRREELILILKDDSNIWF